MPNRSMLNPPLSLLYDDLLLYIVDHVAELPSPLKHLCRLSIVDRAFTQFCQAHIFKVLYLGSFLGSLSMHLTKMEKIFEDKPSLANNVREVELSFFFSDGLLLFNNLTFISILQLLAKSSRPPQKLKFSPRFPFVFGDPILIVGRLMQTSFSWSLTVLHLNDCRSTPLALFLICPKLREILLHNVEASMESYDKYPDGQRPGQELPTLNSLDFHRSERLIKRMITPPPRFHTAVLWSKLRILALHPDDEGEMTCLQPILDISCNTLEELYLTKIYGYNIIHVRYPLLASFVNLKNLSHLRIFTLFFVLEHDDYGQQSESFHDINLILSTIPTSNRVTSLAFYIGIGVFRPYREYLDEHWVKLCDEVVRISGGKHLELNLDVAMTGFKDDFLKVADFHERVTERITSLSEHPNINARCVTGEPCSGWWNWRLNFLPFQNPFGRPGRPSFTIEY